MKGKKIITEKDGAHEDWYKRASDMTLDKLPAFLKELCDGYGHDYGTICHAVAAAALAAAHVIDQSPNGGITGFQAGAVMWEFVRHWLHEDGPMSLVKYQDLLYPQYEHNFKTISRATADWIKAEAKKLLKMQERTHPDIKAHWERIAKGEIPFGLGVGED